MFSMSLVGSHAQKKWGKKEKKKKKKKKRSEQFRFQIQ